MRYSCVALAVFAFVSACHTRRPRDAVTVDPNIESDIIWEGQPTGIRHDRRDECRWIPPDCAMSPRPVTAWGPVPHERPPSGGVSCPIKVRVSPLGVIAEAWSPSDPITRDDDCIPPEYRIGTRRATKVDDGIVVAYAGAFGGAVYWESEINSDRRMISAARFVGFTTAPSGTLLALAVGQARLGQGGVVALDRQGIGDYVPRLVATLPLQPSWTAFDDEGRILTFAQGFIVRIDEHGKIENLHYVAHEVGKVASIARTSSGEIYLGLDCGVLRLIPDANTFREEWWSARDGASGRWSSCETAQVESR
jgi:hypothetical protein